MYVYRVRLCGTQQRSHSRSSHCTSRQESKTNKEINKVLVHLSTQCVCRRIGNIQIQVYMHSVGVNECITTPRQLLLFTSLNTAANHVNVRVCVCVCFLLFFNFYFLVCVGVLKTICIFTIICTFIKQNKQKKASFEFPVLIRAQQPQHH